MKTTKKKVEKKSPATKSMGHICCRYYGSTFEPLFKVEVYDKGDEVDPGGEFCWRSLTVGWALAKGLSPESAYEFANHIRYHTELG